MVELELNDHRTGGDMGDSSAVPHKRRSLGVLALVATGALPGLGHWLAGRRRRALGWLSLLVALNAIALTLLITPRWAPAAFFLAPLAAIAVLAAAVDAYRCGVRSRCLASLRPTVLILLAILVLIAIPFAGPWLLLNQFLADHVRTNYVSNFAMGPGSAMAPALLPGDYLLVHRRVEPQRWSIVMVEHPQYRGRVPTRVAGLPGETVEIKNGGLLVNGRAVNLPAGVGPYLSMSYAGQYDDSLDGRSGAGCSGNPLRLGNDEYYVLGDNSQVALDARLWELPADGHKVGALPRSRIIGCVTVQYRPWFDIRRL